MNGREEMPSADQVIKLVDEMKHAAEYFQNDAPALCKRGASMIEILLARLHEKDRDDQNATS